jgi:hypothetical protein
MCHFGTKYRIQIKANVHAIIESDERVNTVVNHIDKALEELESMENWLLLYAAELNVSFTKKSCEINAVTKCGCYAEYGR